MRISKSSLMIGLAVLAVVVFVYAVFLGQTANNIELPDHSLQSQDFKADFPIVNYVDDRSADPVRRIKNAKYGKLMFLDPNIEANRTEVATLDWEAGLPALPIDRSVIIAIGKIIDSKAYLSDNKGAVYSEFEIEIEKVFKNSSKDELTRGSRIVADRLGGIVRFPTGFETWFFVEGQRMPRLGTHYLLFLSHEVAWTRTKNDDLHLLTAFQFKDGVVEPLDKPSGGTHPIALFYKGKDVAVLLSDLASAISKPK